MKKPGNKKLLKSNRISGFQKADHQKLPIDKTRRIISQKFHFFKIFKVGLIGALIFGILFELLASGEIDHPESDRISPN